MATTNKHGLPSEPRAEASSGANHRGARWHNRSRTRLMTQGRGEQWPKSRLTGSRVGWPHWRNDGCGRR
uniref:Uncharacterized protein n=1 Tax=Oryza nivara TaxID=4536 RepID=A0A0E0J332_ORYNI